MISCNEYPARWPIALLTAWLGFFSIYCVNIICSCFRQNKSSSSCIRTELTELLTYVLDARRHKSIHTTREYSLH